MSPIRAVHLDRMHRTRSGDPPLGRTHQDSAAPSGLSSISRECSFVGVTQYQSRSFTSATVTPSRIPLDWRYRTFASARPFRVVENGVVGGPASRESRACRIWAQLPTGTRRRESKAESLAIRHHNGVASRPSRPTSAPCQSSDGLPLLRATRRLMSLDGYVAGPNGELDRLFRRLTLNRTAT